MYHLLALMAESMFVPAADSSDMDIPRLSQQTNVGTSKSYSQFGQSVCDEADPGRWRTDLWWRGRGRCSEATNLSKKLGHNSSTVIGLSDSEQSELTSVSSIAWKHASSWMIHLCIHPSFKHVETCIQPCVYPGGQVDIGLKWLHSLLQIA
jgi:hypothetical protein